MKPNPKDDDRGVATSEDVKLAAVQGVSSILSAYFSQSPVDSVTAERMVTHVTGSFTALITGTPQAKHPGPGTRRAAETALKAATTELTGRGRGRRRKEDLSTTTAAPSAPTTPAPTAKTTAKKAAKKAPVKKAAKAKVAKRRGKKKGDPVILDLLENFDTYKEAGISPAVPIEKSVTDDAVFSLHTGQPFKMLKSHLNNLGYDDPARYIEFWMLPDDYSLVAKKYSDRRKAIGKETTSGRRPGQKTILKRAADIAEGPARQKYLVEATVYKNYLICLEDGTQQKHLDIYVDNKFGMKWDDYLKKYDLPADYPKVSDSAKAGNTRINERLRTDKTKVA